MARRCLAEAPSWLENQASRQATICQLGAQGTRCTVARKRPRCWPTWTFEIKCCLTDPQQLTRPKTSSVSMTADKSEQTHVRDVRIATVGHSLSDQCSPARAFQARVKRVAERVVFLQLLLLIGLELSDGMGNQQGCSSPLLSLRPQRQMRGDLHSAP